jgi:formate C-acetyltransferase
MDWLARVYVDAMNIIHYMHDKYCVRAHRDGAARLRAAAHDGVRHGRAVGGRDSLSAIKYAKCASCATSRGLITDYQTEGPFPLFGNNDNPRGPDRDVGASAPSWTSCGSTRRYRNAVHTQSILTITSNVVYGKATGQYARRPAPR